MIARGHCTRMEGIRVVRGPDWSWGDQDGGEGCVGTVVSSDPWSNLTKKDLGALDKGAFGEENIAGLVHVVWDSGIQADYRTGFKGKYDLRIVDNSAAGIKHPNVPCEGKKCEVTEILGIRWQCSECNQNLCTNCFLRLEKRHEQSHKIFKRYDARDSPPIIVSRVQPSLPVKGMFKGSKVRRGRDWMYGNEDSNSIGEVIRATNPPAGMVQVAWEAADSSCYSYRRGLKGKVDLKTVEASVVGYYHPEWLPILKTEAQHQHVASSRTETWSSTSAHFALGDLVKIDVPLEEFRLRQAERGGWNSMMKELLEDVATVCNTDDDPSLISVKCGKSGKVWCVNPVVLQRITPFSIGQHVRVLSDDKTIKAMQEKFGNKAAHLLAGEVGKVTQIHDKKQVTVELLTENLPTKEIRTLDHEWIAALTVSPHLSGKLSKLKAKMADLMVEAANEGDQYIMKDLLVNFKIDVDSGHTAKDGVTALHLACRSGQKDVVLWLLEHGANLEKQDGKGRRAIHHAVTRGQKEMLQLLIVRGVELNTITTKRRLTALQKAVEKQYTKCVRLLVDNHCDVNLPDEDGDTPLHNAVIRTRDTMGVEVPDIVDALVSCKRINLDLRNKQGFSVFHMAVFVGNLRVAKFLLKKNCSWASEPVTGTLSTPLHLACLKGNYQMAKMLVEHILGDVKSEAGDEGMLELDDSRSSFASSPFIDARDKSELTPLMLACYKNNYALVELLVRAGADVKAVDKDGDTPIIMTAIKALSDKSATFPSEKNSPAIFRLYDEMKEAHASTIGKYPALATICYLMEKGCNLKAPNKRGLTAMSIMGHPAITSFLECFYQLTFKTADQPTSTSDVTADENPLSCVLCSRMVTAPYCFRPCGHTLAFACSVCGPSFLRCPQCNEHRTMTPYFQSPFHGYGKGWDEDLYSNNPLPDLIHHTPERPSDSGDDLLMRQRRISSPVEPSEPSFPIVPSSVKSQSSTSDAQQPRWQIIVGGSRRGTDVLEDGLGNKYTRRHNSSSVWQCTKQSEVGKNKCPVVVRELNGSFHLSKGPHRHAHERWPLP